MPKILVIDDEEILTKSFSLLLEKSGYEVLTARNGRDAEVMVEEEEFDLIICDIRMPGMNGIDTVKSILNKKSGNRISVIFISGYADEILEKQAQALNPLAYFSKPFNNSQLLKAVKCGLAS